jgi:hypothetical protein
MKLSLMLLSGLAALLPVAARAGSGNSGQAVPDLLIGAITTYATEREARTSCGRDSVVWADRYAGYYYRPNEKEYGTRGEGSYACLSDAKRGNYFDTSPMSSMAQVRGRTFPFTPITPPDFGS